MNCMWTEYKMNVIFILVVIGTTEEITTQTKCSLKELSRINQKVLKKMTQKLSQKVVIHTTRTIKNYSATE